MSRLNLATAHLANLLISHFPQEHHFQHNVELMASEALEQLLLEYHDKRKVVDLTNQQCLAIRAAIADVLLLRDGVDILKNKQPKRDVDAKPLSGYERDASISD